VTMRSRDQNGAPADVAAVVAAIAARFGIDVLYAFGSRAREALAATACIGPGKVERVGARGSGDLPL